MKTEDLIEALNHVSQDYIEETKPEPAHTESRKQKRSAAGDTEAITVSRSNAASGKDRTVKKISSAHRLMTGIAATAACAVFACGGWMIFKMNKQQTGLNEMSASDSGISDQITESVSESIIDIPQGETNFLGGQGELHVLGYGSFLYDDTRFYFGCGSCYADRTAGEQSEYHSLPSEKSEFLSALFFDGSLFYSADERSLYPVENDGTVSDTPFFTLTEEMIPDGLSISAFRYEHNCITRMTDDTVLIQLYGDETVEFRDFLVVYHTDGTFSTVSSHNQYGYSVRADDGSVFCSFGSRYNLAEEGIVRIGTDGSEEKYTGFSGDTDYVEYMVQRGDKLYILLNTVMETVHTRGYGALDLNPPHDVSNIQYFSETDDRCPIPVMSYGGQDFVVMATAGGNNAVLYSTDPSWENLEPIFRSADFNCRSISYADADSRYVMLGMDNNKYAVYDLETGNTQFFFASDTTSGDVIPTDTLHVDESLYHVLDPDFTGTNCLGGQGSLHIPKNGSDILWYDDINYYLLSMCIPRNSNHAEALPAENELTEYYQSGRISSDGEQLYILKNGAVNLLDSSGAVTPFVQLAEAELPGTACSISCAFCTGGKHFFALFLEDSHAYIWTDKDGNILECRTGLPSNAHFYTSDPDSDPGYVYYTDYYAAYTIHRLAAPGSGRESQEFTLPGCSTEACVSYTGFRFSDGEIFYFDTERNFRGYQPDMDESRIIMAAGTEQANSLLQHSQTVFGGKLYYYLTDRQTAQTAVMQYDLTTGEEQALLSFDKANLSDVCFLNAYSNQISFTTGSGAVFFDPETKELFRILS